MNSFLQSQDWMDFQKSLGRKVFEVAGAKVIQHDLPLGKNYLYIPYGPELVSHQFAGELRQLAREQGSIFVKAEPMQDDVAQQLVATGFQKSNKNIQPQKTVVIDLTKTEDELLDAMHHKTRYNIRVAEKHGIHVARSMKHEIFWELMQKTSARDKFSSYPKSYYEKLMNYTELWIAYHQETPVAAALVAMHGDQAYYLHGASDHEHRALMAPYALHWEIIKKLQVLGSTLYDLWGIDANKWPGVTRFKLGWGGRTIEYPGAFDLVISKPWKLAYDLTQKLRM
ncbi:MAG: peptidoglycan bridge formation glycyltransferase FemA/FemB family protein [Patescibacteria group bacterium]